MGRVWRYTPLILAHWGHRQTLEASVVYIVSPCLKIRRNKQTKTPDNKEKLTVLTSFTVPEFI